MRVLKLIKLTTYLFIYETNKYTHTQINIGKIKHKVLSNLLGLNKKK